MRTCQTSKLGRQLNRQSKFLTVKRLEENNSYVASLNIIRKVNDENAMRPRKITFWNSNRKQLSDKHHFKNWNKNEKATEYISTLLRVGLFVGKEMQLS